MPLSTIRPPTIRPLVRLSAICVLLVAVRICMPSYAQPPAPNAAVPSDLPAEAAVTGPTLAELKETGYQRSRFKDLPLSAPNALVARPQANLQEFATRIKPLLVQHCVPCHNAELTEGNIRIDTLDPDLLQGADTDWWQEVFSVVAKEEMPPPEADPMGSGDRRVLIDWLSSELQAASLLRRHSGTRSTFRRLTRYEYNYALQDLLGLPWDFAKDLPPDPHTEEGFENSSALLHLSVSQFETYHRLARQALSRATVTGERPPTLYWGVSMEAAAKREWAEQDKQLKKLEKDLADDPEKLKAEQKKLKERFDSVQRTAYYKQLSTGRTAQANWEYPGAKYAFAPVKEQPEMPASFDCVAILPPGRQQKLVIELGNQLPDEGIMRVTIRAARVPSDQPGLPHLQLLFGWQASNEGRALLRVSQGDVPVSGTPDDPQIIQWEVPLGEIYPRNNVRKTSPMGALPSPSEYIRIANSTAHEGAVQIDYVIVEAPYVDQWPPESHRHVFFESDQANDELTYARQIIQRFMERAWRRTLASPELDRKLDLFVAMRKDSESFEEAIVEVLATVLSSPQFLYVSHATTATSNTNPLEPGTSALAEQLPECNSVQLADRLALFLWSSVPDDQLMQVAHTGELMQPDILSQQIDRMLADGRSERLARHFVRQWLNLELLEFVNLDRKAGRDPLLKEAMQQEPVALFTYMLEHNASVLDFLHADYALVNERLALHYGLKNVYGNEFRRVDLDGNFRRGGLLTQAGTLAMNSDWPDSHPLKRAIWLLERVLNDPPPPPPPAVPQIDLADPEIAKMTLKERIENHRNHAACKSCHTKIDPWGIAFENYDALGQWRDQVGGKPVDASSELFNHQVLNGMDGLKRYLLESRQDQFVEALVHKLTTYALGRPLGFEDHADIEALTASVRRDGDGLRTMVHAIVKSDLFRSK